MDTSFGRLLTLLELLQAYRRLSARDIAQRLEVDVRTVRRYVAGLQEMGIPIDGERGAAGGYRLRPGFRLPPLMFTNEEALAVVLGLLAAQRLGLEQGAAVQGAMAKLDRVLPDQLRGRVRSAQGSLALPESAVRGTADPTLVLTLSAAAGDGLRARLRYKALDGRLTERRLDPYGVAFQSRAWYVVGWDHLRQAMRTLRLDRIQDCQITTERFKRPKSFDVAAHVQQAIATAPWRWEAEVLLETSLRQARRLIPPTVGVLAERPDGVLVRIGADELDWIARFLAGLDVSFRILRPAELRAALAALGQRLAALA